MLLQQDPRHVDFMRSGNLWQSGEATAKWQQVGANFKGCDHFDSTVESWDFIFNHITLMSISVS